MEMEINGWRETPRHGVTEYWTYWTRARSRCDGGPGRGKGDGAGEGKGDSTPAAGA